MNNGCPAIGFKYPYNNFAITRRPRYGLLDYEDQSKELLYTDFTLTCPALRLCYGEWRQLWKRKQKLSQSETEKGEERVTESDTDETH